MTDKPLHTMAHLEQQPLISVVVPTYNQANYLPICLDALLFQDIDAHVEIIVVNDASPDNTRVVLNDYLTGLANDTTTYASYYDEQTHTIRRTVHNRYQTLNREMRIVHHEINQGASATYSHGMKLARGEFVTFVVSDDIPHPSMLSTLVQPLVEDRADFSYADMFIVDDAGRILRKFSLPDFDFKKSLADWYLLGVCKLYRRSLHEQYGYFVPSLANDYECFLRFAMAGARFEHIPRVLYSVRSHDQRKTGLHTSENEAKLFEESIALAMRARSHLLKSASSKNKAAHGDKP